MTVLGRIEISNSCESTAMARYKTIDTSPRFLAVDLQRQLVAGTFERALDWLVDHELDLTGFDVRYRNDANGAPAYPPVAADAKLTHLPILIDPAQDPASRCLYRGCANLRWVNQNRQRGSKAHRCQHDYPSIKYVEC
jgi:hypothetical protein